MRALVVGIVVVTGLWSGMAVADEVRGDADGPGRGADAGAERVLSKLSHLPGLEAWIEGVRDGERRLTVPGDETRSQKLVPGRVAPRRAFEIVTTRPLGTPAWVMRDRGTFSMLWEAQVRTRRGGPWSLEFTSIREAGVFDRTSVGPWPF